MDHLDSGVFSAPVPIRYDSGGAYGLRVKNTQQLNFYSMDRLKALYING